MRTASNKCIQFTVPLLLGYWTRSSTQLYTGSPQRSLAVAISGQWTTLTDPSSIVSRCLVSFVRCLPPPTYDETTHYKEPANSHGLVYSKRLCMNRYLAQRRWQRISEQFSNKTIDACNKTIRDGAWGSAHLNITCSALISSNQVYAAGTGTLRMTTLTALVFSDSKSVSL